MLEQPKRIGFSGWIFIEGFQTWQTPAQTERKPSVLPQSLGAVADASKNKTQSYAPNPLA